MFRIPNLLPALAGVAIGVLAGCKPAAIAPDSAKAAPAVTTTISYPAARRVDQVDDYHGTRIADPYRWLEELDSDETRAWIEAQNALTQRHLDAIPQRAALRQRLEQLWNYERYTPYERHGDLYAYMRNDGLQNQAVLYVTDKPGGGEARVLLDPNTLSSDGTVAFKGGEFSRDGKLFAYGLSSGGSDWEQWRVLDVASGKPLDDMLDWVKFSDVEWAADGSGFYYSRYDKPEGEHALKAVNQFQKLYFHRVGTSQADDRLVYERKDEPDWGFGAKVTDDGRHLLISVWRSTEPKNLLLHRDLRSKNATVRELIGGWTASYAVLGSKEGTLYVLTDDNAPRYRIVAIDIAKPTRQHWREVVPEAAETLTDAKLVGGQLVANYLKDAHSEVRRIALDGTPLGTVELPGLGTATGFTGKVGDQESYFGYTSYTDVPSIYRLDLASGRSERVIAPDYPLDTSVFTTRQVFYTSRDGTRVPMFINSRKGLRLDGNNPTILYGYGGFNISRTPAFSPAVIA